MHIVCKTVFFLAIIIAVSGCGVLFSSDSISDTMEPRLALTRVTSNLKKAKSYTYISKSVTDVGEVTSELEYIAPDRFAMKSKMPGAVTDMIVIGDDSFSRVNGGKWKKDEVDSKKTADTLRTSFDFDDRENVTDIEFAGRETIDGREMFVYKFQTMKPYKMQQTVWVLPKTALPLKVGTVGDFGGSKIESTTVFDFDKKTTIERPEVFQ